MNVASGDDLENDEGRSGAKRSERKPLILIDFRSIASCSALFAARWICAHSSRRSGTVKISAACIKIRLTNEN